MSRRDQRAREQARRQLGAKDGDSRILTVAQYGPDDQTVTKIVAALAKGVQQRPSLLRRWVGTDVTTSSKVADELVAFVEAQNVEDVVVTMGVLGCVHEQGEGKDYPSGESCPFCPFWKDRDRWAGAKPVRMTLPGFREWVRSP